MTTNNKLIDRNWDKRITKKWDLFVQATFNNDVENNFNFFELIKKDYY